MPDSQGPDSPNSTCEQAGWGAARCVLFRFGVIYFVMYFFPFPLALVPGVGIALSYYARGEQQ